MGQIKRHFNDRSDPVIARLDQEVDAYIEFDNPTADQTRQLQNSLARANFYPADQVNGIRTDLMEFSMLIVSDSDRAQRAIIEFQKLPPNEITPELSSALEISLNRLGYAGPAQEALDKYKSDYPLPITERQLDLIVTEIGAKIPLDTADGKIIVRQSSVPSLVTEQLQLMEKAKTPVENLSPEDRALLDQTISETLSSFSQSLPQLNADKMAELNKTQPSERAIILRTTPDEVSKGSFLLHRIEMRAIWEAGNTAIEAAGGRVVAIDGSSQEGGKREIFTRDRFVMVGDKAYLPDIDFYSKNDPQYPVYKSEIDQARKALQSQGIQTIEVPGAWFEGGNIIQHQATGTIFMGLAPDDDPQSAQKLITRINETQPQARNMIAVPMVEFDPNGVYHLDLAMSEPLPNGKMLFDERITDEHTRERIEQIVGRDNIIPITREEAIKGSANILMVGNTALMTNISDRLKTVLQNEGITTIGSSDFEDTGSRGIDEYIDRNGLGIGNGGMRCMGQKIESEPNPALSISKQPSLSLQPAA